MIDNTINTEFEAKAGYGCNSVYRMFNTLRASKLVTTKENVAKFYLLIENKHSGADHDNTQLVFVMKFLDAGIML